MEEKNKNILISSDSLKKLVENYQSKEVVSDFEKGINFYDVKKYKMEDIVLYPLYDERSYSKESLEILERSIRSNGFMFPLFLFEFFSYVLETSLLPFLLPPLFNNIYIKSHLY